MKIHLTWQAQMMGSLLLGLMLGWLFQPSLSTSLLPPPEQAWFVQVKIFADAPPVFEKVQPSSLAPSPTPASAGNSALEVLDSTGAALWRFSFTLSFNLADLPSPAPYRVFSFIVPALPHAAALHLITPSGEAFYDLP